jgi:arginine decarboxylase-like protein
VRQIPATPHPQTDSADAPEGCKLKEMRQWTIKDSAELYNIAGWSSGYFRVNDAGHVEATPLGMDGRSIDLYELVLDLQRRGLGLPLLVRFSDILDSRVRSLVGCFESAIRDYGFKGRYRGVYPIQGEPAAPGRRRAGCASGVRSGSVSKPARNPSCWPGSRCSTIRKRCSS